MPAPQGFPAPDAPLTDAEGNITPIWLRFLLSLWTRTGAAQGNLYPRTPISVAPTASPFTYGTLYPGSLVISGAGVVSVSLSRDGAVWVPVGSHYAPIPMGAKDQVQITYSTAPVLWFLPT